MDDRMQYMGLATWLSCLGGEGPNAPRADFDLVHWASSHGISPDQLAACSDRARSMALLDDGWTAGRVSLHGDEQSVWALGLALSLRVEELCRHVDAGTLPPGPPVAPERSLAEVRPLVSAVASVARRLGPALDTAPAEQAAWALAAIDQRSGGLTVRAPTRPGSSPLTPPPAPAAGSSRSGPILGTLAVVACVLAGAVLLPAPPPPDPPTVADLAQVMPNLTDYRMEGTTLILTADALWPRRPASMKVGELERMEESTGSLDWWNIEVRGSKGELWYRLDDEAEVPTSWHGAAAENVEVASR